MKYETIHQNNLERYRSVIPSAWSEELQKPDFWSDEKRLWIGASTDDGMAVGSILGHTACDFKDDLEISVLFVKPSLRRCGVASEMLDFLSGELRRKNFTKIDCRCYLPEEWAAQETPEPFFDHHGFRRFQLGYKYYFDAKTVLENMPGNPVPEFDFLPVVDDEEWIKSMDARREATLGELYKQINNDFFHLDAGAVKKMRNQIVLKPQGDIWRIVERSTGKTAGWFSCLQEDNHYHVANLCVEPEFRETLFIWQKVGQITARQALEKNLEGISFEVYFWRPGAQRGTRRFGAHWGLKKIVPYVLFRKDL